MMSPNQKRHHTPILPSRTKRFAKNDQGFVCVHCGAVVSPLLTSSRDHCTQCLYSLHVDINPGDRANPCRGQLVPIGIDQNSKKGVIIQYRCDTCGAFHNNKMAPDDNYDAIVNLSAHPATNFHG